MCLILVTGIPASGKSTMAAYLSEALSIPMLSKDRIKELLYDTVGFEGRAQKVKLGECITVDTTDLAKVNMEAEAEMVRSFIESCSFPE